MGDRGPEPKYDEPMQLQNFRLPESEARRLRIALAKTGLTRQGLLHALVSAWLEGRVDPTVVPAPSE